MQPEILGMRRNFGENQSPGRVAVLKGEGW